MEAAQKEREKDKIKKRSEIREKIKFVIDYENETAIKPKEIATDYDFYNKDLDCGQEIDLIA